MIAGIHVQYTEMKQRIQCGIYQDCVGSLEEEGCGARAGRSGTHVERPRHRER